MGEGEITTSVSGTIVMDEDGRWEMELDSEEVFYPDCVAEILAHVSHLMKPGCCYAFDIVVDVARISPEEVVHLHMVKEQKEN